MNHIETFKSAWKNPQFTMIELAPVDVNRILRQHYRCTPELQMTKSQIWDMEIKKASRPDLFIPSVIRSNSAVSCGNMEKGNIETFIRVSEQRLWLDASQYGTVIEDVHIDHNTKTVTFIGEPKINSKEHGDFVTTEEQSLFHVQHGVVGEEDQPLNTWKIVHLTSENEQELRERFLQMNNAKWLPEYIEVYIRNILGKRLERILF